MSRIELISRFRATLLGKLAGDSIAAPYEDKLSERIRKDFSKRGGLVQYDYVEPWHKKRTVKKGQPTDDSELEVAVGRWMAQLEEDMKEEDLYALLRYFIVDRKSFLTDGEAYGSGGTLRSALKPATYRESCDLFDSGEILVVPTNGSVMRCGSVALRFHGHMDAVIEYAGRQSMVTHRHPTAVAACQAYCVMLSLILDGLTPAEAWQKTQNILWQKAAGNPGLFEILSIDPSVQPRDQDVWPKTGSATLTMWAVLWASLNSENFRQAMTNVTLLGGDTDTYAAIAGSLLGAHYGERGIPAEWLVNLQGASVMTKLAEDLYKFCH